MHEASRPNPPPRLNVLGLGVSAVDMATSVSQIEAWIDRRDPIYVCVAAVHSAMDCLRDDRLRAIFNGSVLTVPDGMGLVRLLKWRGFRHVERVYGADLMLEVCRAGVDRGVKHYFYGSDPPTLFRLEQQLRRQLPGLAVAGSTSPPFRDLTPEEDEDAVAALNRSGADILWVGLGSPKQERWIAAHRGRLSVPVMIGVGAAFDFLSGSKPRAPRWMQRVGLEWLFRLVNEPRRLWRRYAAYPLFGVLIAAQALGLRRFPLEEPRRSHE